MRPQLNKPAQKPANKLEEVELRLDEAEKCIKALVLAIKEAEESTGDSLMPVGEFYGEKFEE